MSTRFIFRMTAPVLVTSLLLLLVGVGAAWHIHHLQHRESVELKANVSSLRAAEELVLAFQEIRAQLDRFLLTEDPSHLQAACAFRTNVERWLSEAEKWSLAAAEKQMMSRVRRGEKLFFPELVRLAEAAAPAPSRVKQLVDHVLTLELLQPTQSYLALNAAESDDSMRQNEAFSTRLVWVLLLLGICGSGAGSVAGFGIARAFQRSLVQLSVPIRTAAGHLDEWVGPVTIGANIDLPEMERVLRTFADRIGAIVERLRVTEREVLRAEQLAAVGQMAAGIAHEVRNPLTSMKILVQAALARDQSGGPAASARASLEGRDLLVLEEEIDRLERLLQSFLQFAQPPQIEKRTVDLGRLLAETGKLAGQRAESCGVRIEVKTPTEPVPVEVDAAQVRQVLLNLFLNAIDAAVDGGVVWASLVGDGSGWAKVQVADNGRGLPAALGDRIFAPFVTTKETGLGLGLSISKRIVEAHGGEISCKGRDGGGAVFSIRLPVRVDLQGAQPPS